MAMKNIFSLLMVFSLGACSTMYFDNGSSATRSLDMSEWHHDGVIRLVEFSSPVDMSNRCESKGWKSIKVEKSFVQGLAGSVTYGMYDPWGVDYACK
jgi:hypothetical protein